MVQSHQIHRPPLHSVLEAYVTVTVSTYTAKAGDRVIGVNRAGTVTITLPTAAVRKGRVYTVKDESGAAATNNITVATEGSETIDGSATNVIADNYGAKTYYSDGTNWFTVPLLAVASHTLASHSAKAHSDLTGVGTGDHHAQSHTLDSHTGTLQHEKGGLEADVNAGDGFVEIKAGATTVIKSNTTATVAPGTTDDAAAGYAVGSVWIDTTADKAYVCLDSTASAAVWTEITQSGSAGSDISVRTKHSVSQSIANNTDTQLAFDGEDFDTDTMHDTATNNSRVTIKTAGKYIFVAGVQWAANSTGFRWIDFKRNNGTTLAYGRQPTAASDVTTYTIAAIHDFAVNDFIELRVKQSSGGSLDVKADNTFLSAIKVLG